MTQAKMHWSATVEVYLSAPQEISWVNLNLFVFLLIPVLG